MLDRYIQLCIAQRLESAARLGLTPLELDEGADGELQARLAELDDRLRDLTAIQTAGEEVQ